MKNLFLLLLAFGYVALTVYYQAIQRLPIWFLYLVIASNVISFLCYGLDKLAAVKQWQRTPEKHFYALALLTGWPGSVLGQVMFNHKTTKASFRRWFYFMSIINVMTTLAYLFWEQIISRLN